jgi:hypothetical protein
MIIPSRSVLTGFVLVSSALGSASGASARAIPLVGAKFAAAADVDAARSAIGLSPSNRDGDLIPHSTETDQRLARADAHFNAGRRFYFEGDLLSARREFDASVNELLNAPDNIADRRRIERRLDEISDLIYRFDLEKLGAGRTEEAVLYDKAPIDEISHMTFPVDPALASRLKEELNQTASGIPLELTDQVLSFVHFFESDRGRKILLAGFQRSGR